MARFAMSETEQPSDRLLRSQGPAAYHKPDGLEQGQSRLQRAIEQRKKTLSQQNLTSTQESLTNLSLQETDDLQSALFQSAKSRTKRTATSGKSQLQRSHDHPKRNIQRGQEEVLRRRMAGLRLQDTPSPQRPIAFPTEIVEQLKAYDALELARVKKKKTSGGVGKLHLKVNAAKVMKRGSGRRKGILNETRSLPDQDRMREDEDGSGRATAGSKIPSAASKVKKQVRFAQVAVVKIIREVEKSPAEEL
ncbi:Hypothetical predicted protein [Lecanosticta acicola]|uniref:Ribosome biogenesis protein SLX9 n=1 Tax=Lecanosticta acicola TaxID=111012 RepID=A0AAI8Z6E5_9PEZI|nr:Hypothetical predicted protein [Lecanosticta acicola]